MSIAEMQACLARLYVSESFRKLFHCDPSAALEGCDLSRDEADALRRLDREQLDQFARSLVSKRRKPVERAYPLLFALDAAAMRRYYWRFFQLYPARPGQGQHQDVVDFGEFIEDSLTSTEQVPAYASDLARYERLYYLAMVGAAASGELTESPGTGTTSGDLTAEARPSLGRDVQVADFAYDVAMIEESLQQQQAPEEARVADGCTIVFARGTGGSGARMLRINAATKLILGLCDGRRTISKIVTETEAALGATNLEGGILESVGRLLASGVLVLDRAPAAQQAVRSRAYAAAVQTESI